MNKYYPHLFQPGHIGKLRIKNRIFKSAAEDSASNDGYVNDYLCDFYAEEARGGVGLIICGMYNVSPIEKSGSDRHPCISDDDRIVGMGRIAQAISDNGAVPCCQLGSFAAHATPISPDKWRCVSKKPLNTPGLEYWFTLFNAQFYHLKPPYPLKEYSVSEIHDLVNYYGDAALRAKMAGFSMVEVHAAHRHALGCFLSPLTNVRNDEYGGSVENRARILYEIIDNIHQKCGQDFPISVRLNGVDGPVLAPDGTIIATAEQGQTIQQTIEIAQHLEKQGVNALNISYQGNGVPMQAIKYGVAVKYAEQVRQAVNIPVMSCGSIQTPDFGEKILANEQADFVGNGRAFYADPDWPRKARLGMTKSIRPCIRCQYCIDHSLTGPLQCALNPTVGKADLRQRLHAKVTPRNVAVLGGGPAGIEAALVASMRGHHVTLYESKMLGGSLIPAGAPNFKADIRRLTQYLQNRINNSKVKIVNHKADLVELKDFDVVVVATGAKPITLNIPGIDGDNVYSAISLLSESASHDTPVNIGKRLVVIGGGAVGIETAIWYAEHGCLVSLMETQNQILAHEDAFVKSSEFALLQQNNVQVLTKTRLTSICNDHVSFIDVAGKESTLPCDSVIMAVGTKPDHSLVEQLEKKLSADIYPVGDYNSPRQIANAIHEGFEAAMQI